MAFLAKRYIRKCRKWYFEQIGGKDTIVKVIILQDSSYLLGEINLLEHLLDKVNIQNFSDVGMKAIL